VSLCYIPYAKSVVVLNVVAPIKHLMVLKQMAWQPDNEILIMQQKYLAPLMTVGKEK